MRLFRLIRQTIFRISKCRPTFIPMSGKQRLPQTADISICKAKRTTPIFIRIITIITTRIQTRYSSVPPQPQASQSPRIKAAYSVGRFPAQSLLTNMSRPTISAYGTAATETSAPQQHGTAKQRAFMSMKRLCLFLPFISEPCIRTLKTMSSQEPTSASGRPNNFPLFRSTSATAMLSIPGLQAIPMLQPLTRQPAL